MKNFLVVSLAILICIGGGVYYTYITDEGFKDHINILLKEYTESKTNTDSLLRAPEVPKKQIVNRPRVPKTLKPDKFFKIDEFARKTPKQYEKDVDALAKYLVSGGQTDIEKVRALFTWVATHINYDVDGFNSGNYGDLSVESVLASKKAVCAGYSNLLKALCLAAGFESEDIAGYAKGYGYKEGDKFTETDHAWNAVKVEGTWKLFDATWASGYGTNKNGKMVGTKRFEPYWFDVNPKEFIFKHLPEDSKWQLLEKTISLSEYESLPYLSSEFFKIGFDADKVFEDAVSGKVKNFVKAFSIDYPIKAIQLPYERDLKKGDTLRLIVQSDYYQFIVLDDKKNGWQFFKDNENIFELLYIPKGGTISIYWSSPSLAFQKILEYQTSKD